MVSIFCLTVEFGTHLAPLDLLPDIQGGGVFNYSVVVLHADVNIVEYSLYAFIPKQFKTCLIAVVPRRRE